MWWWCSHFRDLDIRHFWMSHHLCEWICWWYDSVNKLLWLTAVPKIDDINEHCFCANFSASRFKRPMMTNALTKNRKQIKGTNIKFHSIEFKYYEATVAIRFVCTLTRREKKNNRNHYRNVWHRIGDGWNLNAIKYHSFLTLLLRHFFVHFCSRNNEKSKFVKIDLFLSELSWLLQKQTETTMKLRYSLYIFAKAKSEKKRNWIYLGFLA